MDRFLQLIKILPLFLSLGACENEIPPKEVKLQVNSKQSSPKLEQSDLLNKLKFLDTQDALLGKDLIEVFPESNFSRIDFAIPILSSVLYEWRVDDDKSLILIEKQSYVRESTFDEKPTGVVSSNEQRSGVSSSSPHSFYRNGLISTTEYSGFALIRRTDNLLEDIGRGVIYASSE